MASALASHHMGRVVHAYRHHPWHPGRLSQDLVARWGATAQATLSRMESSRVAPQDLRLLALWARTLRIPPELLWYRILGIPGEEGDRLPAGEDGSSPAGPNQLGRGAQAFGITSDSAWFDQRRQRRPADRPDASSSGALPAAARSCAPLESGKDVRRDQFVFLAGGGLGRVLAPPLVHVWHGRTARPAHLDEAALDQVRAQTEGFRWLDRKEGSLKHLPATIRYARQLTDLWRMTDEQHPLRREIANVAGDACHLVAFQAFDQGYRSQAVEWYRCSAELASHAKDRDLYVFAICGVAYMNAKNGDGDFALSVLCQLSDVALSVAARCYVSVYKAHAYASAHDIERALQELDYAAGRAAETEHEPPSTWLGVADGSFVDRQRAIILVQFGAPEALTLLERLDQATPATFQRYRVTLAIDRALTHAHAGDVDASASVLTTAFTLNHATRSTEKTRRALLVRRLLEPYADSRVVRAADEVMQATTPRELLPARWGGPQ